MMTNPYTDDTETPRGEVPRMLTSRGLQARMRPDLQPGAWVNFLARLIREHGFPRGVRLASRRALWREDEVAHWLASRPRGGTYAGGRAETPEAKAQAVARRRATLAAKQAA